MPEQTWSSAGLLSAAVHGLLGLSVDAMRRRRDFAPQLPGDWHHFALRNVPVGGLAIDLDLRCDRGRTELTVDNPGEAVTIHFRPEGTCASPSPQVDMADGRAQDAAHPAYRTEADGFSFLAGPGRTMLRLTSRS